MAEPLIDSDVSVAVGSDANSVSHTAPVNMGMETNPNPKMNPEEVMTEGGIKFAPKITVKTPTPTSETEGTTMDGNAALMAALASGGLGSSNNAALTALAANGGGFGGQNGLWGLIALGLLGRNGGGLFGGNNGNVTIDPLTQMQLGNIQGSIPLSAAQTASTLQNAIQMGTAATTGAVDGVSDQINDVNIATMQGINSVNTNVMAGNSATQTLVMQGTNEVTSAVKDGNAATQALLMNGNAAIGTAMANGFAGVNANVVAQGQRTVDAIAALSSKLDQQTILDLQRQVGVLEANARDFETRRANEINISTVQNAVSTNNAVAAQSQQQQILNLLSGIAAGLAENTMISRATASQINIGSGTLAGNQTPTSTNANFR